MTRWLLRLPPFLWLLLTVAAPIGVVLVLSLSEIATGTPPFTPPLRLRPEFAWQPNWGNYALVLGDGFYLAAFLQSLLIAGGTALLCLLLAFPMALGILRAPPSWRPALLLAVLLPFWTGFLPRLGAWIGLLRDEGWINGLLQQAGLIEAPLALLYSWPALFLGMLHAYLPFAVLPLYASLSRQDPALVEAAADLGASPRRAFWSVTLPLSARGAAAAFLLVFIPAAGEFVIPDLLGPPDALPTGRVLWQEFFQNRDWPVAAALAMLLLAVLLLPMLLFQRLEARR